MTFLAISFIAGLLTVLAPCVLPLLPVVVGSAAASRGRATPYIVVGSLALSVIAFTFILKVSTAFVAVPPEVWTYISGGILALFGFLLVFPALWERLPFMATMSSQSNMLLGAGYQRKNALGDAMVGVALGPIFATCSPTYFVILASILPVSFFLGTAYILAYVAGLSLVLLLIALLGQRFADRLAWASDPKGWFKRSIGILFILLGLLIASGYEKKLEVALLENGLFDITKVEQYLLQQNSMPVATEGTLYTEIVNPSGFVNVEGITIGELVGKKVILVDFMTYSCINCQRTFPYLTAWYETYKDQGLEIVAIHTPEFAFEKDIDNVREAMKRFGITYPVVLDNDYATWRAYGNQYWPRKYLIDIHGNVVYDHIGEGAYEETEAKIRELLLERSRLMGEGILEVPEDLEASHMPRAENFAKSPETYFGSLRNEYLGNGTRGKSGEQTLTVPVQTWRNALYLGGAWNITPEYAESRAGSSVLYRYSAKDVYLVMEADAPSELEVWQDGALVKTVSIQESTLYTLIQNAVPGEHTLELRAKGGGIRLFAFTFG
jgi:cytochrome c biogenesis protein CcdA/glutathione peroxidase-family protein